MKRVLLLALVSTVLVSCGKTNENDKVLCSSDYASDWNAAADICNNIESKEEAFECKGNLEYFTTKHSANSCSGVSKSDGTKISITSTDISTLEGNYKKYINYENGESCGAYVVGEVQAASFVCAFAKATESGKDNCNELTAQIKTDYPDLNCTYETENGEIANYTYALVLEIEKLVKED